MRERVLWRMAEEPRAKRLPNLDDVHSIGIVLPCQSTEEEQRTIQLFASHMAKRDITVALYRLPAEDDTLRKTQGKKTKTRTKTGFPTSEHLSLFSSHTYDIVIAAAHAGSHEVLYAVLSTPALLRVAYDDTSLLPYPLTNRAFDLFIRGTGECDLTDYLRQILILLTNIKKGK